MYILLNTLLFQKLPAAACVRNGIHMQSPNKRQIHGLHDIVRAQSFIKWCSIRLQQFIFTIPKYELDECILACFTV